MIDLDAIRKRNSGKADNGDSFLQRHRDRDDLLRYVDELLAAAAKVRCWTCVEHPHYAEDDDGQLHQIPCPDCADLRRLLKREGGVMKDIMQRVTDYLSSGGLFNPELADHDKVRDLLTDCRAEVEALRQTTAEQSRLISSQGMRLMQAEGEAEALRRGMIRLSAAMVRGDLLPSPYDEDHPGRRLRRYWIKQITDANEQARQWGIALAALAKGE